LKGKGFNWVRGFCMYDVEDCVIGDAVYLLVLVFYLDMDCVGLLVVVGIAARMDAALCSLKVAA